MSVTPGTARDPAVATYAAERRISEVLHFTTNKGLLGIFATGVVLSRDRLDVDKYLEHIYTPNCRDRLKDPDWTDYVSLSISRVNGHMFDRSERWHATEDVWWAVLSFAPSILSDPGVWFATTNNAYQSTVRRGTGVKGLSDMFAKTVPWGHYGSVHVRAANMPASSTTDPQAEVLYPRGVLIDHLRAIYVREPQHTDQVNSWFGIFPDVPRVPVEHKPEVFQ